MLVLEVFMIFALLSMSSRQHNPRELKKCTRNNIVQLYTDIGCTPVYQKRPCPMKFDCSFLRFHSYDKCYFEGKEYKKIEKIDKDLSGNCLAECTCEGPDFDCIPIECPENIQETQPRCIHLYDTLDSCCMSSCKFPDDNDNEYDADDDSLYCKMDGQTFYKGEIYYPVKYPCKKCICKGGLNGTSSNMECGRVSCSTNLFDSSRILNGCVPIYGHKNVCCPWSDWRCPDRRIDKVLHAPNPSTDSKEYLQCEFGSLNLKVNDRLAETKESGFAMCKCQIPPFVTCLAKKGNRNKFRICSSGNP